MSKFKVVFVLGGPGSGKGTQSSLIQSKFPFKHLSAGQLLRQQKQRKGSKYSQIIQNIILQGKIVPSYITVNLLKQAMQRSSKNYQHFLIDGFPRNFQNSSSWQQNSINFAQCPFTLHFICSEKQMMRRLLKRGQSSNRSDDNESVIKKRFTTYNTQTKQVLDYFKSKNKLVQINADPSQQRVFQEVQRLFQNYLNQKSKL